MSHAAETFVLPPSLGKRGSARRSISARGHARLLERTEGRAIERRIHEERPSADRIGIVRIEDHPLRASKREDGLPHPLEGRAVSVMQSKRPRELGITKRCTVGASFERERDPQDDEAIVSLEFARAVSELTILPIDGHERACLSVEHADSRDRLFHLLTVRTDVLDRRRADEARNSERHSTPLHASSTQRATSASHGSPAATSSRTRPPSRAT